MLRNERLSMIIFMVIILITKELQILAIYHQLNGNFVFKPPFKGFEKQNMDKHNKINHINRKIYDKNLFDRQTPQLYRNSEDMDHQNRYENLDLDYGYDNQIFMPAKNTYFTEKLSRRDVLSNTALKNSSSLYPSVLTKALEISLSPSAPIIPGESLFSNVAQKMNTSTLDLAEKIVKYETSKNEKMFQNYPLLNPSILALKSTPVQSMIKNIQSQEIVNKDLNLENDKSFDVSATSNLAAILNRVLNKLDSIKNIKNTDYDEPPEGSPCDVIGSWSSTTMGFCFDIQLLKDKIRNISPAEINNKILSINITECIPAKHHQIIDLDWKFTGSAIKQWGGPFYLYGQKKKENIAATFLGFCRMCGGIDTVFGSWNLLSPSKDCHDIPLANEIKRDMLRRVRMEHKRKERFKNLLYQSRHGGQ